MLWQMTSDVPLTQCYQGWTEQSAAPVYLCFWRKGVAPAAESGSADSQEAIAHIGKLILFFFYLIGNRQDAETECFHLLSEC